MRTSYVILIGCLLVVASGALGLRVGGRLGFGQAKAFYTRRTIQIIKQIEVITSPLIKEQNKHDFESIKSCWDQANELDNGDLLTSIMNNLGELEKRRMPVTDISSQPGSSN